MNARKSAQVAVVAARSAATKAFAEVMRTHLLAALNVGPLSDRKVATHLIGSGCALRKNCLWTASSVAILRSAWACRSVLRRL